jgi:hypothetical protein
MIARMTGRVLAEVPQCPRCQRANPVFTMVGERQNVTILRSSLNYRTAIYRCTTCDQVVLAESFPTIESHIPTDETAALVFPEPQTIRPYVRLLR